MDESVRDLRTCIHYLRMFIDARNQGKEAQFIASHGPKFLTAGLPFLGSLTSLDLEERWAKYDAISINDIRNNLIHPGDMMYLRGDVIKVIQKITENWAVGTREGGIGIFPLKHTVSGPFVMALSDYNARNSREISFMKGEIMPAIPGQYPAKYTVFKKEQYGECSRALFTTMDHLPSVEECRYEPEKYFQYSKLQPGQIRLVYITPGDIEQFIACGRQSLFVTIRHVSLEDVNEAAALSYCWGDPTDKKPIFANGKLLHIPSTLWRLLRREYPKSELSTYSLEPNKDRKGTAILWADAICINQEDTLEKNYQIPLMGSIYGNVRHVHVYVGEGLAYLILPLMALIVEAAKQFTPWTIVPYRVIREKMGRMDWDHVNEFLSQPVFRRSWVIQEIVLAKKLIICYGQADLNLEQILDCVKAIRMNHVRHADSLLGFPAWSKDKSQVFKNATVQLYNLANIKGLHQDGIAMNFLEILESFRHSKARDPRDKVYSLLSLASETYRKGIIPDYSPSNTVKSVFVDLARYAVSVGDIELLLRNAGGNQTISGLPSWVPDWTLGSQNVIPSDHYACGGVERISGASLSPASSQIQLTIRGSLFEKITQIAPKLDLTGSGEHPDTFGTLSVAIMGVHHLLSMGSKVIEALGGTYPNGDDLSTAVWQTLVCGMGWNGKRTQDSDKNHFEAFLRCYQDELTEMRASGGRGYRGSIGTRLDRNAAGVATHHRDFQRDMRTRILAGESIPALSPELEQRAQLEDEMYPFLAAMLHHQAHRLTCIIGKRYLVQSQMRPKKVI